MMPDASMNPGQEAGMKLGDVLEKVNSNPVFSISDAVKGIKEATGGRARFTVLRD